MKLLNIPTGLCISAILSLFSCNDPSRIEPALLEQATGELVDTFSLSLDMSIKDSIASQNNIELMCGSYTDDIFGKAYATAYTGVARAQNYSKHGDNVYDSIAVVLERNYSYGLRSTTQKLNIYRLSEKLDSAKKYTTDSPAPALGDFMASRTFTVNDFIKINTSNKEEGKPVTIRLSDSMGAEWFNRMQTGDAWNDNNTEFNEFFTGIALIPEEGSELMMSFDVVSYIGVFYHRQGETTARVAKFPFSTRPRFTKIVTDRTGALLQNLSTETMVSSKVLGNRAFIQSGTGVRMSVDLSPLKQLFNDKEYIYTVNLAQLLMYDLLPWDRNLPAPIEIFAQEAGNNGFPLLNDDGNTTLISKAAYDTLSAGYALSLTEFASDIVNGKAENYKLYITVSAGSDDIRISPAIFGDFNHPEKPMKLKLYFTKKRR